MTSTTATIAALAIGLITVQTISLSLLGLPVMWIGTRLGEMAFKRGSDAMHRQISIASLGAIALMSTIKGLGELT
jgi:hypothetical protein